MCVCNCEKYLIRFVTSIVIAMIQRALMSNSSSVCYEDTAPYQSDIPKTFCLLFLIRNEFHLNKIMMMHFNSLFHF